MQLAVINLRYNWQWGPNDAERESLSLRMYIEIHLGQID